MPNPKQFLIQDIFEPEMNSSDHPDLLLKLKSGLKKVAAANPRSIRARNEHSHEMQELLERFRERS